MISELSKSDLKKKFFVAFRECRAKTLALFEGIDEATFCRQVHPDFSPVGWHLGHIAYTESLWILERTAGWRCMFPQYRKLFAADGLSKSERVKLPALQEIYYYLNTVRDKVLHYLQVADLETEAPLWHFLLQHESQHSEIITFVLEMDKRNKRCGEFLPTWGVTQESASLENEMIEIPAGEFEMGSDLPEALDNERPVHRVYLEAYFIDRYPVTNAQYRVFIAAGGYKNPQWWSTAGWEWLQKEQVTQPLYWCDRPDFDRHPVCGVSWYEAEAYCRFAGKRLPTEAEWEKAAIWDTKANCRRIYPWGNVQPKVEFGNFDTTIGTTTPVDAYPEGQSACGLYDCLGNVWEWTASWFDGYEGFRYYPYIGYSQVYFDNQHRVLKGGSWATRPWVLRGSFRNWYRPGVRQILAGFRCVSVLGLK